ncbi:MAG: PD-(D/E)XK nuclease family protein, partial [Erysipelotrichaceae bacterium]
DKNPYDEEKLSSNLKVIFEPFKQLYQKDSSKLDVILKRTEIQLKQVLLSLKEISSFTNYKPYKTEVKYDYTYTLTKNRRVHLTGRIDRVDKTDQYYRIIDYKSSDKKIVAKTVLSGNQLQLSTYACLYDGLPQLAPAGAYYYNLSQSNIKVQELSHTKTKGLNINPDSNWIDTWILNHKMKGMTFDNAADLDTNGKHITHIKGNATGVSSILDKSRYNIDTLKLVLSELYAYLYEELNKGNIKKDAVEGACKYCDYKNLCQFHQDQIKPVNKTRVNKLTCEEDAV